MIKVICVSSTGCGASQSYDTVEDMIVSDNEWIEDNNNDCEIYAKVVEDEILVLEYIHNEFDESDSTWIVLKTHVSDEEWNELLRRYIVD